MSQRNHISKCCPIEGIVFLPCAISKGVILLDSRWHALPTCHNDSQARWYSHSFHDRPWLQIEEAFSQDHRVLDSLFGHISEHEHSIAPLRITKGVLNTSLQ